MPLPAARSQANHDLGLVTESQEQVRRVTRGQPDMVQSVASVMLRFEQREATLREKIVALSAVQRALRALEFR